MAKRHQIYKCGICGNCIDIVNGGDGELVCCGEPMKLLTEKTADQGKEKHVPVMEMIKEGLSVSVGKDPHPMEETHFIEWIEIVDQDISCRHYLKPGTSPQTVFKTTHPQVLAREYCSVHGLWTSGSPSGQKK